MQITMYTDGACDIHAENQPGGWAAILLALDDDGNLVRERVLSGGAESTTNNQMELTAVIEGLKAFKHPAKVTVVTDSRYVIDVATGRKKATRNKKLWQTYRKVAENHLIGWQYVAGHSGDALNERCDRLAVQERRSRTYINTGENDKDESTPETDVAIYISTVMDTKRRACAYAAQLIYRDSAQEISDLAQGSSELESTLIGTIRALEKLRPGESATVYTAQEYLSKGMNNWIQNWINKGWKTRDGQPVKYQRHWQRLRELCNGRAIYFRFVRGRENIPYFQTGKEIAARLLDRD